jgi:hypothetical protein
LALYSERGLENGAEFDVHEPSAFNPFLHLLP